MMHGPPGHQNPPPPYGQPYYAPQAQQAQHAPPQAPQGYGAPSWPSPGMPGLGGFANMAGGLKPKTGMPAPLAFGFTLAAVVVALVFDVVFLKITIPGVGGYAWYLTTALSFAGAGYAAAGWTRASKSVAFTALGVAAVLYGLADVGLGLVVEGVEMGSALFLGVQGLVIALVTGGGGIHRGAAARDD